MFGYGNPSRRARIVMFLFATVCFHSWNCVRRGDGQIRRHETAANSSADLASLSDEFDAAETLQNWQRVYLAEKSGADQLERLDINRTRPGWMTLIPHTSTWYQDYRGVLVFKEVSGDFVVTTRAEMTNRDRAGAPRSQFSLGGLMVRTPRDVTPRNWRPGGENYLFLSLGTGDKPGEFAFEVKTTRNSDSQLAIEPLSAGVAEIRVARLGSHFLLLRRLPGQNWTVHRRYFRPDMPDKLQVGFTVYTDYPTAAKLSPREQNTSVIGSGRPDLIAAFEYYRIHRPTIPDNYATRAFANPSSISDQEILRFLGDTIK